MKKKKNAKMLQMKKNVDIEISPKEKCQHAIDEEECICKETNKRREKQNKTKQKHKQKTSAKRVEGGGTSQKHYRCHLDSSYAAFVLSNSTLGQKKRSKHKKSKTRIKIILFLYVDTSL